MRTKYLAFVAAVVALPFAVNYSMAASTTDFQGKYDLMYTRAFTDLVVTIKPPAHEVIVLDLDLNITLENELVPDSALEPVIANVETALEQYRPDMNEMIYDRLMESVVSGLNKLVDEINSSAAVLPDTLDLRIVNARTGLAEGTFDDVDQQDSEPTLMRGSLLLQDPIAQISLMPLFEGAVNASQNYHGEGSYVISDLLVEQLVNGVQIKVEGDLQLDMELQRL